MRALEEPKSLKTEYMETEYLMALLGDVNGKKFVSYLNWATLTIAIIVLSVGFAAVSTSWTGYTYFVISYFDFDETFGLVARSWSKSNSVFIHITKAFTQIFFVLTGLFFFLTATVSYFRNPTFFKRSKIIPLVNPALIVLAVLGPLVWSIFYTDAWIEMVFADSVQPPKLFYLYYILFVGSVCASVRVAFHLPYYLVCLATQIFGIR